MNFYILRVFLLTNRTKARPLYPRLKNTFISVTVDEVRGSGNNVVVRIVSGNTGSD